MGFYCLIESWDREPACAYFSDIEELSAWLRELFKRAGSLTTNTIVLESKIMLNDSLSIRVSLSPPFEKGVCLVRHNIIDEVIPPPKNRLKRESSWYDCSNSK